MSFVTIAVPAIQGALFAEKGGSTIKVYGKESPVVMVGTIQASDRKEGDKYVPTAYGRLAVKAAKAQTRDGKDYLFLSIEGGLQGRLFKAEGKDYDYSGSIDAGNGEEFVIFGRKRKSEGGVTFISLNSAERKKAEATNGGGKGKTAKASQVEDDFEDIDVPF